MATQTTSIESRNPTLEKRNLAVPDEIKSPPLAKIESLGLGGRTFTRFTLQPGWQWTKHVKPLAGKDFCPLDHFLYVVSGRQVVRMKDGRQLELGPGDAAFIPAGHDVWVVGKEPNVLISIDG